MAECNTKRKNVGLYKCDKLPQMMKGFILTDVDWRMPVANEQTLAEWQNALFDPDDRIYYFPPLVNVDYINSEAVYEDSAWGMTPVHDGQYRMRAYIRQNLCTHKNMFTHRTSNGRLIIVDGLNRMLGTRDDNGDFMGLSLSLFHTEKLILNTGAAATKSPVLICLEDNLEVDQFGELIEAKFLKSLIRIVDVITKVVSAIATLIVVDIKTDCDGTAVVGLVAADFLVLNPDGTSHAITSVTESAVVPGRYSIVGVGFLNNSKVTIKTANLLTVDGYEQPDQTLVTIA